MQTTTVFKLKFDNGEVKMVHSHSIFFKAHDNALNGALTEILTSIKDFRNLPPVKTLPCGTKVKVMA